MNKSVLSVIVLAALILLIATPAAAATRLTRYHCDDNFNQAVGAQFTVWWPCTTDWTSCPKGTPFLCSPRLAGRQRITPASPKSC